MVNTTLPPPHAQDISLFLSPTLSLSPALSLCVCAAAQAILYLGLCIEMHAARKPLAWHLLAC